MKLTRIVVSGPDGLKGQRFTEELTGADVFVGPNGSGKSTRLLSVMAGVRGLASVPGDPQREYLGPDRPRADVRLDFDGGAHVLQRDLSVVRGKAATLADAESEALVGPHIVRWDLSDFARDTDQGRSKLIERMCSAGGSAWTPERVDAWLRDRLELPAQAITRHAYDEVARISYGASLDVSAWLAAAFDKARALYTDSNASQKQAVAAVDAMAEERRGAPVAALDLATARERVQALEAEATELRQATRAAGAAAGAAERHRALGDALVEAVDRCEQTIKAAEDDLRRARAEHARAAAAVQTLPAVVPVDDAPTVAARKRLDDAREAAGEAEASHRVAVAIADGYSGPGAEGSACRHCGGADPLNHAERRAAAVADALATEVAWQDAQVDVTLARRAMARAETDLRAALDEMGARERGASVARSAEQAARFAVEAHTKDVTRARSDFELAAAQLSEWQALPAPAAGAVDPNTAARLDAAETMLDAARDEVEQVVRQQEREAAFQRAIAVREESKARFEQVKALGAALKALRELLTVETFGPLQDAANVLLTRAGSDLRASFRDSANYGAQRGDAFIHFAALSDAERAIVGAGIASGFARVGGAPWRVVILDRMEVLDEDHLGSVVEAFRGMVADGELDNFIGAFTTTSLGITALQPVQRWLGDAT